MNSPLVPPVLPPIMVERAKLSTLTVASGLLAACITVFGWGIIYANMSSSLATAQTKIEKLEQQLAAVQQLQFQASRNLEISNEQKQSIEATNKRLDKFIEQFGGKIETISDNLNNIATRIEVLNAKLASSPSDLPLPIRRKSAHVK